MSGMEINAIAKLSNRADASSEVTPPYESKRRAGRSVSCAATLSLLKNKSPEKSKTISKVLIGAPQTNR
jgi:hypothetical protein